MNQEGKENNRKPAVAGQFYPQDKTQLEKQLEELLKPYQTTEEKPDGLICPHAGYAYCGRIMAPAYSQIKGRKTRTVVILGPNHTGYGMPISVYPNGSWQTPLGNVQVDEKTAATISKHFWQDPTAHQLEHSIEVQLPFLQRTLENFKIVPVCMLDQTQETAEKLGRILAETLDSKQDMIIASTDFTHYAPAEKAREKDAKAIKAIENLDANTLYKLSQSELSMCGHGPVITLIEYTKQNKGSIELVTYGNSGETTNDYTQVVGYASLKVST